MKKPIQRSKIRILAGRFYYGVRKFLYWYFSGVIFVKRGDRNGRDVDSEGMSGVGWFPVEVFGHRTVLRRRLKDVDIWMQENKIVNLRIAVERLSGVVVRPGEVFSYWRLIGNPTRRKGYLEGMVLRDGKVISGVGGGLCQLSNLIFWMTLHTPLTVVERWRHGYDVFPDVKRDQPFGSGATCAYPNVDLGIKNDTEQSFQLVLEVDDEYLVGKWLSDKEVKFRYEVVERDHEIKNEWFGAYSRNNKIFRRVFDKVNGECVMEEFVVENHALMMYSPLLECGLEASEIGGF